MASGVIDHLASGSAPQVRRPYTLLAVCGFLLLEVIVVFGQTRSYDFINFDDNIYVLEDSHVRKGLTVEGAAWAFTSTHAYFWHPLTTISHMLDVELFGLNRPGRHHLTSVLMHAATAIALFLAILRLTREMWPSAVVAALFAIHPLRVESVAWIAERKDVLSGFFFALTLLFYAGYARSPSVVRYLLVALSLSLGLMCKPMLVTVPFVLLLLDYWPLGRLRLADTRPAGGPSIGRLLLEKAPLLALALAASVVTVLAQETAVQSAAAISLNARIANAAVSYVAYLRQMFWPAGLAVFYPHPKDSLPEWQVIGAFGLLILITVSAILSRRRWPYLLVGWLWYLGMLVPVIGLTQSGMQARADRFTYLPQIGLIIAIVWWVADVSRNWQHQRQVLAPVAFGVVVLLGFFAKRQTEYWRDSETLWKHTLACTSHNWMAHNTLGNALASSGQVEEAIAQYRKALEFEPDYVEAHDNLGLALAGSGHLDEAILHYRKALAIKPNHAQAHNDIGVALAERGQVDEAIGHYRKALEIKPDLAEAYSNLGNALAGRGQVDDAIDHYRKALEIRPDLVKAHSNLGLALAGSGKVDDAIDHYRKALEIKPDYFEAHFNLGLALAGSKKVDDAIAQYRKALEIKPDLVKAHYHLGLELASSGKSDEAIAHFRKALDIQPDYAEAHNNLGAVLAGGGHIEEAIAHFRRALEIKPDYADAQKNLASALAGSR